jgi:hypothetical protein
MTRALAVHGKRTTSARQAHDKRKTGAGHVQNRCATCARYAVLIRSHYPVEKYRRRLIQFPY